MPGTTLFKSRLDICDIMSKERTMMPQSTAGLIRYFEDSESAIKLKPEHVIGGAVAIIAIEIALKFLIVV
jgi:preprotein translocase subunit Sec61beta